MAQAHTEPIVGVLLAGGQSRRMGGGDKCLAKLAGRPLLSHVVERLRPQTATLVLNANGDPERFSRFELPTVADPVEGFAGPLAGVLAGMDWAARLAPARRWLVSFATDAPFFPLDLAQRLAAGAAGAAGSCMACAESDGRRQPVFALWPVAAREALRTFGILPEVMAGSREEIRAGSGDHGRNGRRSSRNAHRENRS